MRLCKNSQKLPPVSAAEALYIIEGNRFRKSILDPKLTVRITLKLEQHPIC